MEKLSNERGCATEIFQKLQIPEIISYNCLKKFNLTVHMNIETCSRRHSFANSPPGWNSLQFVNIYV